MNKDNKKVETSIEAAIDGNTVLAVRCYQIDFGNHLRCRIKVTDKGIEVEGAINGWGNGVPLSEVVIVEMPLSVYELTKLANKTENLI